MAGRSCEGLDQVLAACEAWLGRGLLDQVLVVGSAATARSASVARDHGAHWIDEGELLPELGPVLGKGDAMWRALSELDTDLIAYCDGDYPEFDQHFLAGLLGPLLTDRSIQFVKATYARSLNDDLGGGGRVTELLARPVLEAWFPEAGELRQPLGGEIAATRSLLTEIPFMTGYAVEAVMLVDVLAAVGSAGIAEVDLGVRGNDHQDLASLQEMAREILAGLGRRLEPAPEGIAELEAGLSERGRDITERPPFSALSADDLDSEISAELG